MSFYAQPCRAGVKNWAVVKIAVAARDSVVVSHLGMRRKNLGMT